MKLGLWSLALGVLGWGLFAPPEPAGHVLIVGGDSLGYLSPCGCVKPMSGGIRRRLTAIRALGPEGRTTVIENGGLVAGTGRQDEIKAETLAEALRETGIDALNLGLEEARLGPAMVAALDRLGDGAVVSTSLSGVVARFVESGPFLIGGVEPQAQALADLAGGEPVGERDAAREVVRQAEAASLVPVLMTRGDQANAERLAAAVPGLALIVFSDGAAPGDEPLRVGETWIVSPGERGKFLLRLEWADGGWKGMRAVKLDPEFGDDPEGIRLYHQYQDRVRDEALLDRLPRSSSDPFAGSKACAPCHAEDYAIWQASEHGHALATLEAERADRDPDCTGCHVVGLEAVGGFVSRAETPLLTDVGCESCHGPGAKHSANPMEVSMPKVGKASCLPCHNSDHSPGFSFEQYWPEVSH